jgi:hypothetical protein
MADKETSAEWRERMRTRAEQLKASGKPWLADLMERLDTEEAERAALNAEYMKGMALMAAEEQARRKATMPTLPNDHFLLGPIPVYLEPLTRKGKERERARKGMAKLRAERKEGKPELSPDHFLLGPVPAYLAPLTREGKAREKARKGMAALREKRRGGKPPGKRGRKKRLTSP